MRYIIKRLPLACSLLLAVCLLAPATLSAQTFSGKCVGVTDGDTIKVLRSGREAKIRLEGIDCPESGDAFSSKAKKFTSSLVYGKSVTVRVKETDRYGRLVARVFADGQDVSIALVQAGLAWHYTKYSSEPALAQAEKTARAAEIGIWSCPRMRPTGIHSLFGSGVTAERLPRLGDGLCLGSGRRPTSARSALQPASVRSLV